MRYLAVKLFNEGLNSLLWVDQLFEVFIIHKTLVWQVVEYVVVADALGGLQALSLQKSVDLVHPVAPIISEVTFCLV